MARRIAVVVLLLVLAGVALVVALRPESETRPSLQDLDGPAMAACETFEPQAGAVRDGSLTGQRLFGLLQDTYDDARLSRTEGFADRVAKLNTVAINGDTETLKRDVLGLQLACQQGA